MQIMHPVGGQWRELYGHACGSVEEAREYVETLGGGMIVVLEGETLPECPPPPEKVTLSPDANPEAVAAVYRALCAIRW